MLQDSNVWYIKLNETGGLIFEKIDIGKYPLRSRENGLELIYEVGFYILASKIFILKVYISTDHYLGDPGMYP